jgi:hypothetical protein
VALDLARWLYVGRYHHGLAVDRVPATGARIVASNVEPEAGDRLASERRRLGREEDIGKIVTVSKPLCPPGERCSPTLPCASVRLGIDGRRCVGRNRRGQNQGSSRQNCGAHREASGRAVLRSCGGGFLNCEHHLIVDIVMFYMSMSYMLLQIRLRHQGRLVELAMTFPPVM